MELRDMKHFYAIAENGNISKAAQKLHMAQPPLSKQMKELEEQLGVKLFERGSRKIRLTPAGQLLHERAEQILGLVDGVVEEISSLNQGLTGMLALGSVSTVGATMLPYWIKEFHEQYPDVTFHLWEGDGYRILELLERKIIEIGIIRPPFDTFLYDSIMLPEEPLAVAMQKSGCCCGAAPDKVRLAELKGQPLLVPLRWRDRIVEQCAEKGFKPNIVSLSDGILYHLLAAKMGIGMALVPVSTEGVVPSAALVYKTIVEPPISTQMAVVWLKNRALSAVGQHFLSLFTARHGNAGAEG